MDGLCKHFVDFNPCLITETSQNSYWLKQTKWINVTFISPSYFQIATNDQLMARTPSSKVLPLPDNSHSEQESQQFPSSPLTLLPGAKSKVIRPTLGKSAPGWLVRVEILRTLSQLICPGTPETNTIWKSRATQMTNYKAQNKAIYNGIWMH